MASLQGDASIGGKLHIDGNLTVAGLTSLTRLIVTGDTAVQNLYVNGKITTVGIRPTISLPELGQDQVSLIDGTDMAGVITVKLSSNALPLTAGQKLEITFNQAYEYTPVIVVGAAEREAALMSPYLDDNDLAHFTILTIQSLQPGKTYKFNYQVMQAKSQ